MAGRSGAESPLPLEVEKASREMDKRGIEIPIREGIDIDIEKNWDSDGQSGEEEDRSGNSKAIGGNSGLDNEQTSEEEEQLPGTKRPKKGAGWWGKGPALQTSKKGLSRDFVDWAGYPSPGRWPLAQRRLPNDELANKIRKIVESGLVGGEGSRGPFVTDHLPKAGRGRSKLQPFRPGELGENAHRA